MGTQEQGLRVPSSPMGDPGSFIYKWTYMAIYAYIHPKICILGIWACKNIDFLMKTIKKIGIFRESILDQFGPFWRMFDILDNLDQFGHIFIYIQGVPLGRSYSCTTATPVGPSNILTDCVSSVSRALAPTMYIIFIHIYIYIQIYIYIYIDI